MKYKGTIALWSTLIILDIIELFLRICFCIDNLKTFIIIFELFLHIYVLLLFIDNSFKK